MKYLLLVVLICASSCALATDIAAQAQHDVTTPAGKQYEIKAAKFAASILSPIMAKCVNAAPSTFNVYLTLSTTGAVLKAQVDKQSNIANCFASEMSKITWPDPPFAPFVYGMEMFGDENFGQ